MDDQQLLQLLHDKQPLLWNRAEGQLLWEHLQESELLRQSLRSNTALRDRAATVVAQADHDLDALLAAEAQAAATQQSGGTGKKVLLAICAISLIAVVGTLVAISQFSENAEPARVVETPQKQVEEPANEDPSNEEQPVEESASPAPGGDKDPKNGNDDNQPAAEETSANQQLDQASVGSPEPVAEEPAERPYVSGPWDAVIEQEDLPTFAQVCFDDFDQSRHAFGKQDMQQWVTSVAGQSHEIGETKRHNRQVAFTKGLVRLQAPWTEESWLRLNLDDTKQFFIHLYNGQQGLTLAHYVEGSRMWAAYVTTREAGKYTPQTYALTACDDLRNSRTIRHEDGTIMIGWRAGEMIVTRGDVVLLRAPLAKPPREAFFEGRAVFEGLDLVRTTDAPEQEYRREMKPLAKPAELEWDTERLTEKAHFEKLADGSVKLSCTEAGEPTWVMAPVAQEGIRSIVFELSDYAPGASVLLRHQEKGLHTTFRIVRNTPENHLTLREITGDHHTWQQDLGKVEEKKLAEVGERVFIKLLQGSKMLRAWVSADGEHWAELMFPATQHHVPMTGIGLMLAGGAPDQQVTLRSLHVEPLAALQSLVSQEVFDKAPTISEPNDYGSWLVEVTAQQPEGIEAGAWRRACAMRTVGAGCEKALAEDLLGSLLDYAVQLDIPLERKCNMIDDAVLIAYGWEDNNKILKEVTGRYFQAGKHAYLNGETERPYSSVRRRAMSGPYVHYSSPRISQTDAVQWELLHLTSTANWQAALDTTKQLQFFDTEHHKELIEWAAAIAQRGAATKVGSASITPLKASWRHPLEEELSKETYNLVAELKALLDSQAYVDAARLITMVNPTGTSGVAPSPHDDQLLLSLSAAIHWAIEEHPQLAEAMNTHFADLAQLRVKKAIGEGFEPDVTLAAAQFAPTPAAAEAHAWLGDRALSVGRFQQAIVEYRLAMTKADSLMRSRLEPRLRLAGAMLGKELGSAIEREVQLGEATVAASDFEQIVTNMRSRANDDTNHSVVEVAEQAAPTIPPPSLWKTEKRGQVEGPQGRDPNSTGNRHARDLKVPWADRQMVVQRVADRMIMANRFQVSAYRLTDGGRIWASENPPGNPLRSQEWPLVPMRPLIVGDRIVTRMLYDVGPKLICFSREDGKIQWTIDGTRSRLFASDPLWIAGELMVVVWDYTRDQNGQLALNRYDLHSGELVQSQPLINMRDSWFERRVCEVAPLNDGLLIAAGGAILKATTQGQVAWIRRQELTPPEEHAGWAAQYWQRPIVRDRVAYVMQPGVMAIEAIATETGESKWQLTMTDLQRVLGVVGDHILLQREGRIVSHNRHDGSQLWSTSLDLQLLDGYALDQEQLLIAARQVPVDSNREVFPELLSFDVATGQLIARSVLHDLRHQDPQIGSLVPNDDRLWLFYGRGSHEVNRDIMQLTPQRKLAPLPPKLPLAERVWTGRVDPILQEAVARNAPGWQLWHSHYDSRDNLGYREEDHGRHDLAAFLLTAESPLVLARRVHFTARSRPKLRLIVGAEPGRNWQVKATVAGNERKPLEVNKSEYNDYWKTIEIDLTEHAGATGWLTLELTATSGTHYPLMLQRLELVQ